MKKIILTLAVIASSLFAFAGDDNVSKHVLKTFNKEFNGAQEVKWTEGSDYFKASFILNDQYITAFYNKDGQMLGITRNISSTTLPVMLQTKIRSEYSEYWISDLFELTDNEGTHYYITVENANTRLVLKSAENNDWSVFKKTTKL